MKIKKFTARTLNDGKLKVAKELGDDAIILSSRTIKLSDSGDEAVELVAALDDNPIANKLNLIEKLKKEKLSSPFPISNGGINSSDGTMLNEIFRQIDELKDMVYILGDNIKYKYSGILGPVFGKIYKALRKSELNDELSLKIAGNLLLKSGIKTYEDAIVAARELATKDIIIDSRRSLVATRKNKDESVTKQDDEMKVIWFIGPTGSGKTSSLIKLALAMKLIGGSQSPDVSRNLLEETGKRSKEAGELSNSLEEGKYNSHEKDLDIMVISTDVYKIGGADELEAYCSIAEFPFTKAYNSEELKKIINDETGRDYIFIDTVGRSHKDNTGILEIAELKNAVRPDTTYLVVNANINEATFREVLNEFSRFNPDSLIITKVDETNAIGGIISVLTNRSLPIAYLTTGQRIPEDVVPASKNILGELLINN